MATKLVDVLSNTKPAYTGWIGIPDPLVAEISARAGYDLITLDMQHGMQSYDSILRGIGAVILAGVPAMVRIPVGDFATATRALDAGADGVIAPMINSVRDAEDFVEAVKFPPVGGRSWGPNRALMLKGYLEPQSYLEDANADVVAIAMIETPRAIAVVDDILSTPGIDGIFMGPSDLSVTLSEGSRYDPRGEETTETIRMLTQKAKEFGKLAAAFALSPDHAVQLRGFGVDFMALGTDSICLKLGTEGLLAQARR